MTSFDGKVLIYIHKETELADVQRWHPARRYVLVDDKAAILAAVKAAWGDRVTTVFPKQGHYAHQQPPRDGASGLFSSQWSPRMLRAKVMSRAAR